MRAGLFNKYFKKIKQNKWQLRNYMFSFML